jgi:hypothetical protein
MKKNAKNATKKLGRPDVLKPKELVTRYEGLKQFFEHNWGRIGLELRKVRNPERVRTILKMVPQVEWCIPFREGARLACLLKHASADVNSRELRLTRKRHDEAVAAESRLSSEFYPTRQKADEASNALRAAISPLGDAIQCPSFFCLAAGLAEMLSVRELTKRASATEANLRETQQTRRELGELVMSEEGWHARNEVVKFVRSRRYVGNPENFAKAMAGLPEYGWLHSFRKCEASLIKSTSWVEYSYQLFEILKSIVQKVKPLKLSKVELKLRDKLLDADTDPPFRAWVAPNWAYMKQAFAEHRGKRFNRSELPYKIMGTFLANVERSKSMVEVELAKREQLL